MKRILINKLRLYPADLFISNDQDQNLAGKSVRGGMVSMSSTGVLFVINIARTIVLARLLTPADFGIIGMVAVFIGFIGMFKDAGLSTATVQKDEISQEQISTLAWLNFIISAALGIIIIIGSPLVSWFYNKPELTMVTIALAVSFILSGLIIQHLALLRRHMRFGSMALIAILSTTGGVIISILLALNGWHYWALVAGSISMSIFEILLTFFFCPWFPGPMKRGAGVRSMLKFGLHLTGSTFFNYFSRNADNILIGKFIGAEALGLYQKAYQLFLLPINNIRSPINQVAIPVLSSLQKQPERYANYFRRIINITATLSIPLAAYMYLDANFIIILILGEQWTGAVQVFKILAIIGLTQAVVSQGGLVMISYGYSKRYFHWGIIHSVIAVSAFSAGISFGIEGVATAYAIAEYFILIPSLYYFFYKTPITPGLFMNELVSPFLISSISAAAFILIRFFLHGDAIWYNFIYATVFFILYGILTWQRKAFRETFKLILKELKLKN